LSRIVGCNPVLILVNFLGHSSHSDGNGIVLIVYHTNIELHGLKSGLTE
jgi:hypothetical protein